MELLVKGCKQSLGSGERSCKPSGQPISIVDKGKFLFAARRYRRGAHSEYIISLDADDLSQGSNVYLRKLR
ncbi:hypothetical protein MLD38_000366 [Melastoma candidum]|uniref:Uncharacterized protein n=1 Tax=Melastoma candidum TaxID=119954 RepID=A0ACB9SBS8_9MYRT|nr:hypothetical protein MLD38_000366 [Melastoma candidum]